MFRDNIHNPYVDVCFGLGTKTSKIRTHSNPFSLCLFIYNQPILTNPLFNFTHCPVVHWFTINLFLESSGEFFNCKLLSWSTRRPPSIESVSPSIHVYGAPLPSPGQLSHRSSGDPDLIYLPPLPPSSTQLSPPCPGASDTDTED